MNEPIFRGQADSFLTEPYMPETGLIAPPAATVRADEDLADRMASAKPPQVVLFDLDECLNVRFPSGKAAPFADTLCLAAHRACLILHTDSEEAAARLPEFADRHNIWDATLCVPYEKRSLLPGLRAAMPLSRGMLDMRTVTLPEDPIILPKRCQNAEATMILIDTVPARAYMDSLRRRFLQVWLEGSAVDAVCCGACGLLTEDTGAYYSLLGRLPERSVTRPPLLFAHKGYHNTGEYPENSIAGVEAAGRLGYDAAEIDVTMSSDGVLLLQHDHHTEKLFTEKRFITQTPWEELKKLRRRAFPSYGLDRFKDLMVRMRSYPETPVLIEIKTPLDTYLAEEAVRRMRDILSREDVQKCPTCIMGIMPPGLDYIHKHLPGVPVAHCTWNRGEEPTADTRENSLRLYRFARETAGANAGFDPYHRNIGMDFIRLAHLRGITVFPWTLAFEAWEDAQQSITESYLSGCDALTSDWVEKFSHIPVDLIARKDGSADALLRNGTRIPAEQISRIPLDETCRFLCAARFPLPTDKDLYLLSRPV
ncbi:MAG: hypothetical protein J5859_00370 [Clostridia bacterium]|nr:hypothetical protein [Clostridia bacterium]